MTGNANPIGSIVDRFGGQTALARAIGSNQSTVWDWVANGVVPSARIPEIIAAGLRHDPPIRLEPNDFFAVRTEAA